MNSREGSHWCTQPLPAIGESPITQFENGLLFEYGDGHCLARSHASLGRKNIPCCADCGDVLNYRRFRELMPPVGLYSESRPDRTRF